MQIGNIKPVDLEQEMKGAYLDYAMSVITARALPDVRDGLKPVQRRILYAMDELSLRPGTPYKKSARIVGEVLGKYHPHGDAPVYEAMVRLAQDFSMRYQLVDGQGNFGSVDGDPAAAMRYTEARMARITEELLADIDKDTVDFAPNFDDSLKEPKVLPGKLPNLLLNGASGIAVGMATNIPPHNLGEVVDALHLVISRFTQGLEGGVPFSVLWSRVQQSSLDHAVLVEATKSLKKPLAHTVAEEAKKLHKAPGEDHQTQALLKVVDDLMDVAPDELVAIVKGPDFPTAGIIVGDEGIKSAYTTGHGRVIVRAKAHIEDIKGGRSAIVITELPFQVNKASLLERIAELVRDRRVEGISDLRDESDRQGMRVVIELKRDTQPRNVLNQLFKFTSMQTTFSINMLALVDGQPRVLTLKMLLMHYVRYRREVVTRRIEHDLDKARKRAHILEGLKIALDNLDAIISTIRNSRDAEAAKTALIKNFKLSEIQAQAILDMQLRRLAALERKKILDEYAEVLKLIAHLEDLLAHPAKILYVIRDELAEIKEKYGDPRRTKVVGEEKTDFTEEDLIQDQPVLVTLSAKGYIRRISPDSYRTRRGGKGESVPTKDDEGMVALVDANTLDSLIMFTNRGKMLQLRVRDLPETTRQSKGLPLSNFAQMEDGEKAVSLCVARSLEEGQYFVLVTRMGDVKRVAAQEYSSTRAGGLIALSLGAGDELVWAGLTGGSDEIMIASSSGQVIRFGETEIRPSGRTSGGVRGLRLGAGEQVIGAARCTADKDVIFVSLKGFSKRTSVAEYPAQGRAGGGVKGVATGAKSGAPVAFVLAGEGETIFVSLQSGAGWRLPVESLTVMGRVSQGVGVIEPDKGDPIVSACVLVQRAAGSEGEPGGGPDDDGGDNGPSDTGPCDTASSTEGKKRTRKAASEQPKPKGTTPKKESPTKTVVRSAEKKGREPPVEKGTKTTGAPEPAAAAKTKRQAKVAEVVTVAKVVKGATKTDTSDASSTPRPRSAGAVTAPSAAKASVAAKDKQIDGPKPSPKAKQAETPRSAPNAKQAETSTTLPKPSKTVASAPAKEAPAPAKKSRGLPEPSEVMAEVNEPPIPGRIVLVPESERGKQHAVIKKMPAKARATQEKLALAGDVEPSGTVRAGAGDAPKIGTKPAKQGAELADGPKEPEPAKRTEKTLGGAIASKLRGKNK